MADLCFWQQSSSMARLLGGPLLGEEPILTIAEGRRLANASKDHDASFPIFALEGGTR